MIRIDDERLWDILFKESCVEGEQASKIYEALKEIDEQHNFIDNELLISFNKERVVEELKSLAEDSRKYWSEFNDEDALGEMNAYTRAIEIVEKGGAED